MVGVSKLLLKKQGSLYAISGTITSEVRAEQTAHSMTSSRPTAGLIFYKEYDMVCLQQVR